MALRIQNNVEAYNAHRNLSGTENRLATSMERLSSGYRINRAADDAAGLAISERLRGQIGGLDQAQRNAQDAVSLVQTAEGSLTEVHAMLHRMRDLAVQYKNGALSNNDRTAIQSEVNQLASEIERIGASAEFNGIKVLNTTQTLSFQVGAADGQVIAVSLISLGAGVGVSYF
ncbi:MAG: flagellin, partial [Thermoleophilaceae bacterium]|nr:flagellin [Thermoleophilaceae bacterium]